MNKNTKKAGNDGQASSSQQNNTTMGGIGSGSNKSGGSNMTMTVGSKMQP